MKRFTFDNFTFEDIGSFAFIFVNIFGFDSPIHNIYQIYSSYLGKIHLR